MAQYNSTYNALIALLGTFVVDDSSEYTSNVQGFVNRAEERVLRDIDVQLFNTNVQTTTSNGQSSITKSNSESPIRTVFLSSTRQHVLRRTRSFIEAHGGSGIPVYFCDDQSTITFAPVPDSAYAITINQLTRPIPLSASNQTNWISLYVADLLLWACLIESEMFLISPENVQNYTKSYADALGPIRANWRELEQNAYDQQTPTPTPTQDR
jgi:hypothetical protein